MPRVTQGDLGSCYLEKCLKGCVLLLFFKVHIYVSIQSFAYTLYLIIK